MIGLNQATTSTTVKTNAIRAKRPTRAANNSKKAVKNILFRSQYHQKKANNIINIYFLRKQNQKRSIPNRKKSHLNSTSTRNINRKVAKNDPQTETERIKNRNRALKMMNHHSSDRQLKNQTRNQRKTTIFLLNLRIMMISN